MVFRRRTSAPLEPDPLVHDRHGRVVGVRTPPARGPEETPQSRRWRRRAALAATGELRLQAELRNQVAVFHIDPARR